MSLSWPPLELALPFNFLALSKFRTGLPGRDRTNCQHEFSQYSVI